MSNLRRWADEHQYDAAPMQAKRDDDGNILPTVHLLWMTPDPLGSIAAMCRMYEGTPTYSLSDITDDDRVRFLEQVQKTHLKAPLEAVKIHFFIEGVTRSWTHQHVRQRTAVYAQESLRFAVKGDLADSCATPPSIAVLPRNHPDRQKWDEHLQSVQDFYEYLVGNGYPAEDARGVLPHAVTTRTNYVTDLRNLSEHAGNRLCTQAQFEWRIVFMEIVKAIREYTTNHPEMEVYGNSWQFEALANSGLFRPVCYQLGKCVFKADFDRSCTIRSRVDANEKIGRPSNEWHLEHHDHGKFAGEIDRCIEGIDASEWLLDPAAARKTGGAGHD